MGKIKKVPTERHIATASPATIEFVSKATTVSLYLLPDTIAQFPKHWPQPRGDLYHWIPLLDRFDNILELFVKEYGLHLGPQVQPFARRLLEKDGGPDGTAKAPSAEELDSRYPHDGDRLLIETILHFTRILLEKCGNRSLYSSSKHLDDLLHTTSLTVLEAALQLTLILAQRYQHARLKNNQPHAQASLLASHYHITLDNMHKLALPIPKPRFTPPAAQTPVRKEKATEAMNFNPADLMTLVKDKYSVALRKDLSSVTVTYNNSDTQSMDQQVAPSTPTPSRRQTTMTDTTPRPAMGERIASASASSDTPTKSRESYFPASFTRTFELSAEHVHSTESCQLVQEALSQVPKELHFEVLQRIRIAKAFASNDDSLRTLLDIRLLAVSNLAYAWGESKFQERIGLPDSNESRRYHLATQLCDLLQPLSNGQRLLTLPSETIVLDTLEALARCKHKSAEVVDALAVSVNHGVLYYMLRQSISTLRVDDSDDQMAILRQSHWRQSIFDLITTVSQVSNSVKCAEKMVAAGIMEIFVDALTIRTSSAERVYEKVMGFLTSFIHGIPTAFQALTGARGLEIITELASFEVSSAMEQYRIGAGLPESFKSKVVDYSIPYYKQATLRAIFKFIVQLFEHHHGVNDRLLRNLLDSPYTLGALREIIGNANMFGSNVWHLAVNTVSSFIHNEPTSYQVIAEAGLAKGILEAATQKPVATGVANYQVPRVYDASVDDIQVRNGIVQLPIVSGILPNVETIMDLPTAFGAICLNEEGMNMFLASGALEAYFDVFLSPPHVRAMDDEGQTAYNIGNAYDELSRHHPGLQEQILAAVIRLVKRVHSLVQLDQSSSTAIFEQQADSTRPVEEVLANRAPALPVISVLIKFLEGFLINSSMCQKFCESGSAVLVLDLVTSPATPYDLSHLSVVGKVVLTFCRMTEEKGHLVLPELLARLRTALGAVSAFTEPATPGAFQPFVDATRLSKAEMPDGLAKALSNVSVLCLILARILHVQQYGSRNGNNAQLIMTMSFTDVYATLLESLGKLHTFALRESNDLATNTSATWKAFSEIEPSNVRSVDADGNIHTNVHCAHCGYQGMDGREEFLKGFEGDQPATKVAAFRNLRMLRFVLAQIPTNVELFFSAISQVLAPKRMESLQKRHASLVARSIAHATIQWFEQPVVAPSVLMEVKCMRESLSGLMKIYLKPAQSIESFGAKEICTLALTKFYAFGGFQKLEACQTRLIDILNSDSATDSTIRSSAEATLDLLLMFLARLCSNRTVNDAQQSINIAQRGPDSVDYFHANQFLVELRCTIIKSIIPLWNSDGLLSVGLHSMKWVIDTMREVFKGDGEDKALRRSENLKRPDNSRMDYAMKPPVNKEDVMVSLMNKGFDQALAAEACARCNNNIDNAIDYARLRRDHGGPRFPFTDLERFFQVSASSAPQASTPVAHVESITIDDHGMRDSDSEDENMGTLGRVPLDMLQQDIMQMAESHGFPSSDMFPASTNAKDTRVPYITVDDLNDERQKLRANLIDRCLEVLSVQNDITHELSALIQAAVSRSGESANPCAEWGKTLVSSLLSLQGDEGSEEVGKKIAAYAHLVALVLQDRDFFDSTLDELKDNFDSLLSWVQLEPDQNAESAPWVQMILLILEQVLAEDEQPPEIIWSPPPPDEPLTPLPEAKPQALVVSNDMRSALFDAVVDLLPKIGKQDMLALSAVRILVILTRRQDLAKRLTNKLLLSRLFVMIRQLAKPVPEKLQGSFMVVLRHMIEDDATILQTMRTEIRHTFENPRSSRNGVDTTTYVRSLHQLVLRQSDLFVQATKEMTEVINYNGQPSRPQFLGLKKVTPETSTTDASHGDSDMLDPKSTSQVSSQNENTDGVVHFLLRELSNFKDVEDKPSAKTSAKSTKASEPSNEASSADQAKGDKPAFDAKDHVIYMYRCFIMQCLSELVGCYTRTKVEFINFSRRAEHQSATPSRPRSGTINYLLNQLLPVGTLEHRDTAEHREKAATSEWATTLLTALCCRTFERLYSEQENSQSLSVDASDSELAIVRRFVLEHAIRAFKDALASAEDADMRYARLLALADLFERMLNSKMERASPIYTSFFVRQTAQIGRLMYEKNFIGILTSAIADLDLNFAGAKRAVKHILAPLKALSHLSVELSQQGELLSTDPSSAGDEEDLSSATSLSGGESADDEREQTPDLFRNSTLSMYEASGMHDDEDSEDEDEEDEDDDEEMYEAGFDEEMDYDDGNGETISDEDEDEEEEMEGLDEEMGEIEGLPGDMAMEVEIVEGDSEDEDTSTSEDDSEDQDEDDDDHDHNEYYEGMEEVNGDDENASFGEDNEADWEEEADYEHGHEGQHLVLEDGDALEQIAHIIGADDSALDPHGDFVGVAANEDGGFFQDEIADDGEDDDDDDEDGEEDYEAEFGYEPEVEEEDDEDGWGFEAGPHPGHVNFRQSRRNNVFEDIFGFMGYRHSGLGRFHRTHHHHHHNPRLEDEGINPLLQRSDNPTRDPYPQGGFPMLPPPIGRAGGSRVPASFVFQDLLNSMGREGNPFGQVLRNAEMAGHGGHVTLTLDSATGARGLQLPQFNRLLDNEHLMVAQGQHGFPMHYYNRSPQSDEAHAVEFRPALTAARWSEEARILFGTRAQDKAMRIVNAIFRVLVPAAMAAKLKQDEEARKAAEEQAKENARRVEEEKREREEAERKQKEAEEARLAAEAEAAARAASIAETAQEDDIDAQMTGTGAEQPVSDTISAPLAPPAPRITAMIRGQEVDITNLGIDHEYLQALPEEFREEVIMSQFAEQRSQAQQAGEPPDQINREFLEALPEDIQRELLRQENAERRRREARESRRQAAESGSVAPIAQAQDMDAQDFLAMLDPGLRNQILMDVHDDQNLLESLPPDLQREARAAMRDRPQRGAAGILPRLAQIVEHQQHQQPEKIRVRPVVQMLDKAGVATLLRLMFINLPQTAKTSLRGILSDVCKNTQNRAEVISILLSILQDGTADVSAVERSFAQLSLRARQSTGPKTPQPLKRSLTGQLIQPVTDLSPLNIVQQCLSTLVNLSEHNPKVQTFFLSEHETLASQKIKTSKKPKSKESAAAKYPINVLLTLLDRKLITENTSVMEVLAGLLSRVTQPLQILAKKAKQAQEDAVVQAQLVEAGQNDNVGDQMEISVADLRDQQAMIDQREITEKKKSRQRELEAPDVPEENVRLVINILAARECPSKTFSDTLDIIKHMSAIPDAKAIFGRELIRQASELGGHVVSDLDDLTQQINKAQDGADVQAVALVSFSSAGSKQRKLLRILVALDHLFDPKRMAASQPSNATADIKLKDDILASLYDSDTFQRLWKNLSSCLVAIRERGDLVNVATVLLPLIESLMVVCRNSALRDAPLAASQPEAALGTPLPEARMEGVFFSFTEEHRKILNELIRNNPKLMNGNLSILAKNSKVLEFDNKRSYFNRKLHNRGAEGRGQHPVLTLNVRREDTFMDSYKALFFKSGDEIKNGKLNIRFNGEEGVDAGGVTREWFAVMARQMFNPDFALFNPVASDRTTFHPNRLSDINDNHLQFFKFIGRVIGKALYEGRVLDCHFSRAVYRRILGKSVSLKDMESLDLDYYKSLVWILENDITDITFETFSIEVDRFGVTDVVDLIPDGRNIAVTEDNKQEYVRLVVEHRLTKSVEEQLNSFLGGFHEIIPAELIAIFNEQELELLISGLPEIDVDDWKNNTEYHNYQATSAQIQWFWRAVKSFDPEERAKLLQFVTGTSKVPLNGFKELEGMNGFARFNIHRDYSSKEKLPTSHTCFNQLDLPEYESYEHLRQQLYTAITAGSEYFGFA